MPEKEEVVTARKSRGQLHHHAQSSIDGLENLIDRLGGAPARDALNNAAGMLDVTQTQLDKFSAAVVKCHVLEELDDEQADEEAYAKKEFDMSTRLLDLQARYRTLKLSADDQVVGHQGAGHAQAQPHQHQQKMPNIPAPEKLEPDIKLAQFDSWRNAWKDYVSVTGMNKYDMDRQRGVFRTTLSLEMRSVLLHALDVKDDTKDTVDEILDKIRKYIRSKRNVALDRVAFEERKQQADEDFDSFLVAVKELATNASLCETCLDQRLATRIMAGVRDSEVKKKLLAISPFPQLQAVVDLCRSEEAARKNEADLSRGRSVNKAFRNTQQGNRGRSRSSDRKGDDTNSCKWCGHSRDHATCPAKDKTCNNCERKGHFASVCMSKKKDKSDSFKKKDKKTGAVIRCRDVTANRHRRCPTKSVEISSLDGVMITKCITPDSGAEATLVPYELLEELEISEENLAPPSEDNFLGPDGGLVNSVGRFQVKLTNGDYETTEECHVCYGVDSILLAWYACVDLGILHKSFPETLPKDVWEDPQM